MNTFGKSLGPGITLAVALLRTSEAASAPPPGAQPVDSVATSGSLETAGAVDSKPPPIVSGDLDKDVKRWADAASMLFDLCNGKGDVQLLEDAEIATLVTSRLCTAYCAVTKDADIVDFCAFRDPLLAAVGLVVAPGDMSNLAAYVVQEETRTESALRPNGGLSLGILEAITPGKQLLLPPPDTEKVEQSVTALLQRGLSALAKVIVDRAKREAVGWLLDDVASELCGAEVGPKNRAEKNAETWEISFGDKCEGDVGVVIDGAFWFVQAPGKSAKEAATLWVGKNKESLGKAGVSVRYSESKAILTFDGAKEHGVRGKAAEGCQPPTSIKQDPKKKPVSLVVAQAAQTEVREHWLPNLCALASEGRLDHYGAGAALLEALRGALENDVRGWPGVLAGIGLGEFYYAYPGTGSLALIECSGETSSDRCAKVTRLRTEGERFVARLLDGRDPALASRDLGTAISAIVVGKDVESPQVELLACGISLPAEVELLERDFTNLKLDRPLTAAILAGLVRAPACWELTGKGRKNDFTGDLQLARGVSIEPRERLSTIIRLGKQVQTFERVQVELDTLRKAIKSLDAARAKPTAEDASEEARARAIFLASLAVVDASLASADAVLSAAARFSEVQQTFPAIVKEQAASAEVEKAQEEIKKAQKEITALRDLLHTLQGFGTGEYAKAITASSRMMVEKLETICGTGASADKKCDERVDAVIRHVGTITAILTAETVEDMAAALDAAANPPGGWRSKAMDDNFTVSLSAYPGFFAGMEARWGQYGAVWEQGRAYWQAPTLTLPFGLDLAWGMEVGKYRTRNWAGGLFFPLLDPAAFLLYDAQAGGKLPGPRPVTALSPGVAVRLGIPNTPLAVLLSTVYRPQLRTWEATVNGPGANVLQFGVSIAVDVTLWKIYARGK